MLVPNLRLSSTRLHGTTSPLTTPPHKNQIPLTLISAVSSSRRRRRRRLSLSDCPLLLSHASFSGGFSLQYSPMGSEEMKESMKEVDWKSIGGPAEQQSDSRSVIQKRLPKRMRQIPDYYFLPRRSLPSAIAFYGSFIAAGIGAGMLLEVWIEKKVKVRDLEPVDCMEAYMNCFISLLGALSIAKFNFTYAQVTISGAAERMEASYGNSTNDLKMPSTG
ncbi:hypothetical protein AKJ16_DCAP01358 [Drosera capensis]